MCFAFTEEVGRGGRGSERGREGRSVLTEIRPHGKNDGAVISIGYAEVTKRNARSSTCINSNPDCGIFCRV